MNEAADKLQRIKVLLGQLETDLTAIREILRGQKR